MLYLGLFRKGQDASYGLDHDARCSAQHVQEIGRGEPITPLMSPTTARLQVRNFDELQDTWVDFGSIRDWQQVIRRWQVYLPGVRHN